MSLAERVPSRIPEFTAVQEEAEERYRSEQAERVAQEKADKLLTKLKQTKDLASLAKAEALTVEETGRLPVGAAIFQRSALCRI